MKRGKLRGKSLILVLVRIGAGLTQEEAAQRAKVSRPVISRVENGHSLSDDLVEQLIDACGGLPLLDWILEVIRTVRDWYQARKRIGPLLNA